MKDSTGAAALSPGQAEPCSSLDGARLERLVAHRQSFSSSTSIEDAHLVMHQAQVQFAVVEHAGKVIGLVSRHAIDHLLGYKSGIGSAVYGRRPVTVMMLPLSVSIRLSQNLTEVLSMVFKRGETEFHDDIPLLTAEGAYLGMIPVRSLVVLQNQILSDKLNQLAFASEELNKANKALEAARDSALEAVRVKAEFLANMSHEIRTPMNGVIGMTTLLFQTKLDSEQRDYVETILQSGQSLLRVLNDILDFSKIESGRLELEAQPTNLEDCLLSCLHLFATKANEKNIELIYSLDPRIPAVVGCDQSRLQQILANLVGNAVKFTESGHVQVKIERISHREQAGQQQLRLRCEVHDTGIGIPHEKQSALFKPFSQVDASTARRFGGTGLGLAISRRLVELMGGRIGLSSEPGHGSTFWFELEVTSQESEGEMALTRVSLAQKTLLVADDNPLVRQSIAEQCRSWGMRVTELSNLEQLQALASSLRAYDYLLLDAGLHREGPRALLDSLGPLAPGLTDRCAFLGVFGQLDLTAAIRETPVRAELHKPVGARDLLGWLESRCCTAQARDLERDLSDAELAGMRKLRLLVAEDNVVNQKVIAQMLRKLGCRADLVMDGEQALVAVERGDYDLVFMDVQMPQMDGLEAARRIRALVPARRQPRIVALTANSLQGDEEACLQAGMDAYLAKPVAMEAITSCLIATLHGTEPPLVPPLLAQFAG